MATKSFDELKTWAENYTRLWNAGDKQAWIDSYRRVGPGNFRMLDPVGTPRRSASSTAASIPGISSSPT